MTAQDVSKKEYSTRLYRPGDEREIVQLLQLSFPKWKGLDFWRWMYQDNPLKRNIVVLAVNNNRIIGCGHDLILNIKIGDKIFVSAFGDDSAVHPDFRRMGIYSKLVEVQREMEKRLEIKFSYWYTDNPILIDNPRPDSISFPQSIAIYSRIRDVGLHLRSMSSDRVLLKTLGFHTFKLINQIRAVKIDTQSSTKKVHISEVHHFDESVNALWDDIKDNYDFILERTQDYLNWRYCDPRMADYVIKQAEADGRVLGYIVLRVLGSQDYPFGCIVDLLTLPDRLDVADALVVDAVKLFGSKGINVIECLVVKGHPYERILQKDGFIDLKKQHVHYVQQGIEEEISKLNDSPSKVHLSYGDLYLR